MAHAQRQEETRPPAAGVVPRLALPRLVIRTPGQARRHIRAIERDLRERIQRMDVPDRRRLLRRGFEGPFEALGERLELNRLNSEVLSWMDRGFLGRDLHRTFSANPPYLTEESTRLFERFSFGFGTGTIGEDTIGMYLPGTNHMIIDERAMSFSRAELRQLIAHEQLHYASFLGGGGSWIRWGSDRGEVPDHCPWLHEGLTELHAQQLSGAHGHPPSEIGYPIETVIAYYIQRIVGERPLREAYLSGDFSAVRSLLNRRLGEGTFETLVGKAEITRDSPFSHLGPFIPGGLAALYFLRERMDSAGVDRRGWRSDPILGNALEKLNLT